MRADIRSTLEGRISEEDSSIRAFVVQTNRHGFSEHEFPVFLISAAILVTCQTSSQITEGRVLVSAIGNIHAVVLVDFSV